MIAAGVNHAKALALLHAQTFPTTLWDAASFTTLLAQPGVSAFIQDTGFLLLRVAADEAEILTIGVVDQRRGTGRALMHAAIASARAAGAVRMFLEVAAQNTAARSLYAALGFTEAGRRSAYYEDGGDALLLALKL
jgi:ribosomal-protein-alanine N-acetyltransferase